MITRNFEITIRIPEQNYIPTLFQVVENDNDVYNLTIHITDGINEIDYSQVSSATITFLKGDGNVVQGNLTVGENSLTYTMGTNEISCPGKVLASIQLFGSSGERLTTARFRFEVVADLITPGAVQSESHFPLLQQLVADVEQLKQDIVDTQIPDGSIMDVKLSDAAGQIKQRFASHMAANVSQIITFSRDLSLVGTQQITGFGFQPKAMLVIGCVNGEAGKFSITISNGAKTHNISDLQNVVANSYLTEDYFVKIIQNYSDITYATLQSVDIDGVTLNWGKAGNGATGTFYGRILALTH